MLVYQRVLSSTVAIDPIGWISMGEASDSESTSGNSSTSNCYRYAQTYATEQQSFYELEHLSYPGQLCVFDWFGWYIPITNRHNAANKLDQWTDFIKLYKTIKIVYSLSNYINKTSTQDYSSHLFTLSCTQSFQSSHLSPLHLDVATWFRWHSQPRQSVGARPVRLMCWGIHKVVSSSWDYI